MKIVNELWSQDFFEEVTEAFELDEAVEGTPEEEKVYEGRLNLSETLTEGTAGIPRFDAFNDIGSACWYLYYVRNGMEADLMTLN